MFIEASHLAWWAWLGWALLFAAVGTFAFVGFSGGGGIFLLLLMISSGLVAIGCAFIGFVRFVRWAWG